MKVLLVHPQIPQNAGNIVRTCAVTGSGLVMLRPLGFSTSSRQLKRAGLDYWEGVDVEIIDDLEGYLSSYGGNVYFFSSKASKSHACVAYQSEDLLIFGSETDGLPAECFTKWSEQFYRIPMLPHARCLNLSNAVSVVLYEAWRQQGFCGMDVGKVRA